MSCIQACRTYNGSHCTVGTGLSGPLGVGQEAAIQLAQHVSFSQLLETETKLSNHQWGSMQWVGATNQITKDCITGM